MPPRGENHYKAVLTPDLVRSIRADYKPRVFTMQDVADKYEKPLGTVRNVILYYTWKHVL